MRWVVSFCWLSLLAGCSESTSLTEWTAPEPAGVRDGDAAIGVAMHAYLSMRQQKADAESLEAWRAGSEAKLEGGIWEVSDSTISADPHWGLVFYISAVDGRIIGIYHRSPDGSAMLPLRLGRQSVRP